MTPAQYWIIGLAAAAIVLPVVYYAVLKMRYGNIERADERHTTLTDDGWRIALFRYLPRTDGPRHPVLLCHGAFANHHNFDIPAGTSLADYLADRGYDVWLMDFRGDRSSTPSAGRKRSNATADEYLLEDMPAAVDYVLEQTGCETLHAVGHSMGGMFWMAYAIEFEGYGLASLTTIGSPVNFEGLRFHPHRGLIGLIGLLAPIAEPIQRVLCSWVIALKWRSRVYPMNFANQPEGAGPREGFHKADLLPAPVAGALDAWTSTGDWRMAGGELAVLEELASIATPWQMICARLDGLTPPHHVENTAALLSPRTSRAVWFSVEDGHAVDYGHIDLVIGRHAPDEVFPAIVEWFETHPASGAPTVEPRIAEPAGGDEAVAVVETFVHEEAIVMLTAEAEALAAPAEEAPEPIPMRKLRAAQAPAAMEQAVDGTDDIEAIQRRRLGRAMARAQVALHGFADEEDGPSLPGASLEDLERTLTDRVKKASKRKAKPAAKTKAKPKAKAAPAKKAAAKPKAKAAPAKKAAAKKPAAKAKPAAKKKGAK